ncbi:MAG: hypothetical protein ACI4I5_04160 [Acutalibacteraceae bacterium]
MTKHSVITTENIKNNIQLPTNLADGDLIETTGYYVSNDGGAGTFTVRTKDTEETADNMFTYSLNNDLIAELQTPNGVVNIDQLGAKGDGIIPDNYVHSSASALSVNNNASDNVSYLNAALAKENIQKIELTENKNYVVRSSINFVSGHDVTIDGNASGSGNSASILQYNTSVVNTLDVQNGAHVCISNMTVYGYPRNCVVGCKDGNQLTMKNVTIYSSTDGICFYSASNPHTAKVENCHIYAQDKALNCAKVEHSLFKELTIAPSNNYLTTGISLAQDNCSNSFRNISITGNAQTRSNSYGISSSIFNDSNLFDDIRIDGVNTAVAPGSANTFFNHIFAINWNYAVKISMTSNATIQNSTFLGSGKNAFRYTGLECDNVIVRNCLFETTEAWIDIDPLNSENSDSVFFDHCKFRLTDATNLSAVTSCIRTTAKMDGVFLDCIFDAKEYPLDDEHTHGNAALFCFTAENGSYTQNWIFNGCQFVYSTENTVGLNSPIRIDAQNRQNIHVLVKGCALEGFRWTMRISNANETSSSVSPAGAETVIVNPAFSAESNDDLQSEAISRMNETASFGALGNLYILASAASGSYYKAGEQYGITD